MYTYPSPVLRQQHVQAIVENKKLPLITALESLLKIGTETFELKMGIISRINPEQDLYTVEVFYPEGSGLHRGQAFKFSQTYCEITTRLRTAVGIPNMRASEHHLHPCYEAFRLEAYFGVPLMVRGKLYGTVNFASSEPRLRSFDRLDRGFLADLAWASAELISYHSQR